MPSARAERTGKAGSLWAAGIVLSALAAFALVVPNDDGTEISPPELKPPVVGTPITSREDSASELLNELSSRLVGGSKRDVVRLAAEQNNAAKRLLMAIHSNVRRLGIRELSLRYVDEDADPEAALSGPADRSWVADVQVGWRIPAHGFGVSEMEIELLLQETTRGASFVSVGSGVDSPAPIWLLTRLAVTESRRSLVIAADPSKLHQFTALARRAVRDVENVLPRWDGTLVLEVPEGSEQLHDLLGAEPGTYAAIAAVTATVDGSSSTDAPVHVFLNPEVFGRLGRVGSQIVLSHEAAHVATGAATSTMPMWLLEGFADYVALANVDLPVSVTASQVLSQVRRDGPPQRLPEDAEFDPTREGLGASYESAWLACRLLAEQFGERRLIEFYRTVDGGTSIDKAFRQVLGSTDRAFTQDWRQRLRDLAG